MNLLILLIGSNPVPNYVASEYFLNHCNELNRPDTIMLIFSEKTTQ